MANRAYGKYLETVLRNNLGGMQRNVTICESVIQFIRFSFSKICCLSLNHVFQFTLCAFMSLSFMIISQVCLCQIAYKRIKPSQLDKMQLNFKERDFVMHIISPRRLVQFWHIFQISLVVLIINCTPSRVITYINMTVS